MDVDFINDTDDNMNVEYLDFETDEAYEIFELENVCKETLVETNASETTPKKKTQATSISTDRHESWRRELVKDSCTSISPDRRRTRSLSPSEKIELEDKLKLRRKIKTLQETKYRQQKKIASQRSILKDLQDNRYLRSDEVEVLEKFDSKLALSSELLKRQICKLNDGQKQEKKYSATLRSFALTLHYYSPCAYNYVRDTFNTCLPHPKTLHSWYKNIEGKPGFNEESFKILKTLVEDNTKSENNKPLLFSMSIDEMAIRKHIEFDGNRTHGYCEVSSDFGSESFEVATQALVILLVGINNSYKIPIGYFLIHTATGEQRATLVRVAVEMAQEVGVQVTNLTFDGAPSNFAMARCLGCQLDSLDNLKPYFEINSAKIFIFPDPSHMIKLVRNTFGDKKKIVNMNGDVLDWTFLENLNELQLNEGLHLGNKLRSAHLNFKKKIMNVRLAVQLFSQSVAYALKICCDEIQLPQFQQAKATWEFIEMFNNIFDIFNTKNSSGFDFKRAICQRNCREIFEFLEIAEEYIKNLKFENDGLVIKSQRKCGFMGFIICFRSLKQLFKILIEEQKTLIYFPTYKISQDHLEMFFGKIRAFGKCNNNPTSVQFKSAYKKLLIHTEVKGKYGGNCLLRENSTILKASSAVKCLNKTTRTDNIEDDDDMSDESEDEADINVELNQYNEFAVSYIAGFVTKRLEKKVKCPNCVEVLLTDPDESSYKHKMISIKSRGGLKYPSNDVVKICEQSERVFKSAKMKGDGRFNDLKYSKDVLNVKVLDHFINNSIFKNPDFEKHLFECVGDDFTNTHYTLLIKAVADMYYKVRYCHYIKSLNNTDSPRTVLNKLVLFKGF